MGETQHQPFQLSFDAAVKVEFQGSRVTSDGGLILVRELDERLGFSNLIAQHLTDSRGRAGALQRKVFGSPKWKFSLKGQLVNPAPPMRRAHAARNP